MFLPLSSILISLMMAAFFSGLEISFISSNKLRVELKSKQGSKWASIVSAYFKTPSKFISTILVAYNIALVIYGVFIGKLMNEVLDKFQFSQISKLLISTVFSTAIALLAADFIPKALFRINPELILSVFIYPFQLIYYLLYPVVHSIIWLSKQILKLVTKQIFIETGPAFSKVDLGNFITETLQSNKKSEVDAEILINALDFGNVKVRDCIVPRTEIAAIDYESTIEELLNLFTETRHSKILIYKHSIDNIVGYIHQIDMFKKPRSLKSIMVPILITNESRTAQQMLNEFVKKRKSIALVVDEFGGTAGIITVEDIIEEILGEIEDEHDDNTDLVEKQLSEYEFEFSAALQVDYLNEKYNFKIPEGEYETLAGYIIAEHGSFPSTGEILKINKFRVEILKLDEARIDLVRIKILEE
ncbi:MAG: HlyC/CorC family transporter [Bacteroidetes bacterium]|nr:HlyC/CorC family transporter [Bacteroidota bacterium]